jgi:hypothetical protein
MSASRDPAAIRDAEGMFHDDEGEPHEWREAGGRPRRIAGVGREDEVSQERAVRETREGWLVGRGSTRIGIYFTSVLYILYIPRESGGGGGGGGIFVDRLPKRGDANLRCTCNRSVIVPAEGVSAGREKDTCEATRFPRRVKVPRIRIISHTQSRGTCSSIPSMLLVQPEHE